MLGFVALALHAWAEAAAGRRRARHLPLMALSLGATYWSHYFAIFALAPLCAGELVRLVRNRRADGAPWRRGLLAARADSAARLSTRVTTPGAALLASRVARRYR